MSAVARLLLLLMVALASTVLACGSDGGEMSLDGYFSKLERISIELEDRQADLEAEYAEVLSAEQFSPEFRDGLVSFLEEQLVLASAFREDLASLNPPEEAAAEHQAALEAFDEIPTVYKAIMDDVRTAESFEELGSVASRQDLSDAINRTSNACIALQTLATDNDIDVNLECESPE